MTTFADRLQESINKSSSYLVAGLDPRIEDFPSFLLDDVMTKAKTREELAYKALTSFYATSLEHLQGKIAAVKPNIAFFEQYGIGGLRAFADVVKMAKEHNIPVIADCKRGDIGSTATAYSAAFLGRAELFGGKFPVFDADALTVNPFLGFDTVETFFKDCIEYGKGIFVLVKTSNPGSASTQGKIQSEGAGDPAASSLSEKIALWLAEKAQTLAGSCGYSGLGAVVGATYPQEARYLRSLMPTNFFLIPGLGAQGGTAEDSVAGFAKHPTNASRGGAVINVSRGLFGGLPPSVKDKESFAAEIKQRADKFNSQIKQALQ